MPNINADKIADRIAIQQEVTAELIARAVSAAAEQGRSAKVSITYDVKFDRDSKGLLHLHATAKIKSPTGLRIDQISSTDDEVLMTWRIDEDSGQMSIFGGA